MTTTHQLKVERRWYDRTSDNQKTAEIRFDDRDYQTGDRVCLRASEGPDWLYCLRTITHVLRSAPGLAEGYVILSLADSRIGRMADLESENATLIRSNRSLRARAKRLKAAAS